MNCNTFYFQKQIIFQDLYANKLINERIDSFD